MKVLVLLELVEGRSPADLGAHAIAENRMVWDLYVRGTLREMSMRGDAVGAVLALETADAEEARLIAEALPMVEAGLLSAQVIPLSPFKPLESLFAH